MDNTNAVSNPTLSYPICACFKAAIEAAKRTPGAALRITFRKADDTIREMDIAYDPNMLQAISGTRPEATAKRAATNEARRNIVVRERLLGFNADGKPEYTFQWRTIPIRRILDVKPILA